MQGGTFVTVLLLAATIAILNINLAEGSLCEPGKTWWDAKKAVCLNCTLCDASKAFAVLRPCEVHQDTLCAPLGELDIDWSWIPRSQSDPPADIFHSDTKRLRYKNEERKSLKRLIWRKNIKEKVFEKHQNDDEDLLQTASGDIIDEFQKHNSLEDENLNDNELSHIKIESEYVYLSEGFTWDWQTSTLLLAAVACILFFIVVGFYSIYHTRQWRHIRNNIRSDIDGLPVKLSLILTAKEIISESEASTPDHDQHYSTIQYSYLEKLLAQNNKLCKGGPGNVYIRTADK